MSIPFAYARIIASAACIFLASCGCATASDAPASTISAEGVRVVHLAYQDQDNLRPYGAFPGTSLAVRLTMPAGGIVTLDREASVVSLFADELGTDLLKQDKSRPFHHDVIDFDVHYAKDHTACLFELTSEVFPAHGAQRLHARGVLVLDCASRKKLITLETVRLTKGANIALGSLAMTVSESEAEDDGLKIGLESHSSLSALSSLHFFAADGQEIACAQLGTSTSKNEATKESITTNFYHLGSKPTQLKMTAEVWTDLHRMTIPYDMTTGVGL